MAWRQVIDAYELLDSAYVSGARVAEVLQERGLHDVTVTRIEGEKGHTDFIKAVVPGSRGRASGGDAPTLGVVGRLGGLGARPERIGFVSDGDGALTAVSFALKLAAMRQNGDVMPGDVLVATHICPNAPTQPHEPVPFMGSPVDMAQMNRFEVDERMEAILSVDTTKGNRIINLRGFAISPTVRQGYILRVSEDLLELMQIVTGRLPAVFAITTQDITPYGNDVFHVNSILQPATATSAPVVGVAITAEVAVPGCATGASHLDDVASAMRFCLEVAKAYGAGKCKFHDEAEFARLQSLYGDMSHLQTMGGHG
ncbi:MAG: DUF1177 domain-containing protein [Chloroflexi bacterium]|nr:DUF1177 domain-containing protein [Chloroflexota bacterium]MDA8217029.1 DUF1177 domain-containing protein [Dehalococcoidales bacterium]